MSLRHDPARGVFVLEPDWPELPDLGRLPSLPGLPEFPDVRLPTLPDAEALVDAVHRVLFGDDRRSP